MAAAASPLAAAGAGREACGGQDLAGHHRRVQQYYRETAPDYRLLWSGRRDMAVHFGYYDRRAASHRRALSRMNEVLADCAAVAPDDRVLDAGCGYGGSAAWLAAHRECQVTGVTIAPFQAAVGRDRLRKQRLRHLPTLLGADYSRLPFSEHSFTVYWGLESLCHAADLSRVLREAWRVLQPGGRLVVADCFLRDAPPLDEQERAYIAPWLEGWSAYSRHTVADFCAQLRNAGFTDCEMRDYTGNIAPSLRRLKRLCRTALPGARMLSRWGVMSPVRVANVVATLRSATALEKGLWKYFVVTARR